MALFLDRGCSFTFQTGCALLVMTFESTPSQMIGVCTTGLIPLVTWWIGFGNFDLDSASAALPSSAQAVSRFGQLIVWFCRQLLTQAEKKFSEWKRKRSSIGRCSRSWAGLGGPDFARRKKSIPRARVLWPAPVSLFAPICLCDLAL